MDNPYNNGATPYGTPNYQPNNVSVPNGMPNYQPNNVPVPNGTPNYPYNNGYPAPAQQMQPVQNAAPTAAAVQKEKSGKGFVIAGAILLGLGIATFWVPILGVILCLLAMIFFLIAMKRKKTKRGLRIAGFVVSIVFLSLAVLMSAVILPRVSTVESSVKRVAIERVCNSLSVNAENTSDVSVEKLDETSYHVSGEMSVKKASFIDEKMKYYKVDVDCIVTNIDGEKSVEKNQSKMADVPYKTEDLPSAISKINEGTALKRAEEEFHRTVKLKDEASYVRNDYAIDASYYENGDIKVRVILDYSAKNSFGGMVRSYHIIELKYHDGNYTFVNGYEVD